MKFFFACLGICGSLWAGKVELFMDWKWDAKGQELFQVPEGVGEERLSLTARLRKRLEEKGWQICSWERDLHRPELLGWSLVKSWQELKWRLGWGLPQRKEGEEREGKDLWVFWSLGPQLKGLDFSRVPKERLVLFMWEPPTVQAEVYDPKVQECFGKIFTWDDSRVDNRKFFKFYYPCMNPRIAELVPFEEKKFCTLIASRLASPHPKQLYGEREKAIRFFEDKPGEFDLYGRYWEKRRYKNWKGAVPGKIEVLKNYKFSICYENTRDMKGYITEKIFDCFTAGCVPVYWGAEDVAEMIPEGCFIDRRKFADYESLYRFLKGMSAEEYQRYLDCAAEFLKSEKARRFTAEYFVETFIQAMAL